MFSEGGGGADGFVIGIAPVGVVQMYRVLLCYKDGFWRRILCVACRSFPDCTLGVLRTIRVALVLARTGSCGSHRDSLSHWQLIAHRLVQQPEGYHHSNIVSSSVVDSYPHFNSHRTRMYTPWRQHSERTVKFEVKSDAVICRGQSTRRD